MIGAKMMLTGVGGAGVFNMEQMDPDPFMEALNRHGLPWTLNGAAALNPTRSASRPARRWTKSSGGWRPRPTSWSSGMFRENLRKLAG